MDATQLLKEKERERDRDKEKERKSKLNNSAQIFNSNNTNNNAHIKQRNNIHSNSSNESSNPSVPNEHILRLEADIKRLKADLQVSSLLNNLFIFLYIYIFRRLQGSQKQNCGRSWPYSHPANDQFEPNCRKCSKITIRYKQSMHFL